jgi:hypothetical protein
MLRLFYNGYDYIIAESQEAARDFLVNKIGTEPSEAEGDGFVEIPLDQPFTILDEDTNEKETMLVSEWIERYQHDVPSILCSTEY